MGTTPRGIFYPDDSSPIEDLQDYFQQAAETTDAAIDAIVTGVWQTPTLLGGWVNYNDGLAVTRYIKIGPFTVIEGSLDGSGASNGELFYLPPGYRPTGGELRLPADSQSGSENALVTIDSDGRVWIASPTYPTAYASINCIFYSGQ